MKTLEIYVNHNEAKFSAWMMGVITVGLYLGMLYVAFLSFQSEAEPAGPIVTIFAILLFGWMFWVLTAWTLRLFRLSRFEGPILILTPNGVLDFWSAPKRELLWHDILYTKWHNAGVTANLQIIPKDQPFIDRLSSIVGLKKLDFPKQYLSVPDYDIAQYVIDHAPRDIIR